MAKKKKNRRRPRMKWPLLTIAGGAIGVANLHRAGSDKVHNQAGDYFDNLLTEAGRIYIGYDRRWIQAGDTGVNNFNAKWMWGGTWPLVIGAVMSKLAGRYGINRMFKGLPVKL